MVKYFSQKYFELEEDTKVNVTYNNHYHYRLLQEGCYRRAVTGGLLQDPQSPDMLFGLVST